jgi:hypothetical protein
MQPLRLSLLVLLLAFATAAPAQGVSGFPADSAGLPQGFDQTVYKGLVGNVLDAIPMDPSKRLDLQRTNAVVGNTLLGRTLTLLAGLSNPVLLLGGLAWGLWAASNIRPALAGMKADAGPDQTGGDADAQARSTGSLAPSLTAEQTGGNGVTETVRVSSLSAADPDAAAHSNSHVVKIWLPQRAPLQPQ